MAVALECHHPRTKADDPVFPEPTLVNGCPLARGMTGFSGSGGPGAPTRLREEKVLAFDQPQNAGIATRV
jgi:hypothetical protein